MPFNVTFAPSSQSGIVTLQPLLADERSIKAKVGHELHAFISACVGLKMKETNAKFLGQMWGVFAGSELSRHMMQTVRNPLSVAII